jgi:hypothetical protein
MVPIFAIMEYTMNGTAVNCHCMCTATENIYHATQPLKTYSSSVGSEIPTILWNRNVYYRAYKSTHLVHILLI